MSKIPAGFVPLETRSPFAQLVGPFYVNEQDAAAALGLLVEERHCNSSGRVHGGLVATLADLSLGRAIGHERWRAVVQARSESDPSDDEPPPPALPAIATAHLSLEFIGAPRPGDWLEMNVRVQKTGSRLCFANAELECNGRPMTHASGVYQVIRQGSSPPIIGPTKSRAELEWLWNLPSR